MKQLTYKISPNTLGWLHGNKNISLYLKNTWMNYQHHKSNTWSQYGTLWPRLGICWNRILHIFMCCWPCSLVIFDFMFQLNAPFVYYIFFIFLYMFRAILWSSSGGSVVYTQHLVLCMSLFLGDRSVHRQLEDAHIPLHVPSNIVLIIRRIYCIHTASGSLYVTLLRWPLSAQAVRRL